MKSTRMHPLSFLAGCGLALVAFVAMGLAGSASDQSWEYKIANDVTDKDLAQLANEGWEFAGYLGEGTRGSSNDETLWKRPSK